MNMQTAPSTNAVNVALNVQRALAERTPSVSLVLRQLISRHLRPPAQEHAIQDNTQSPCQALSV